MQTDSHHETPHIDLSIEECDKPLFPMGEVQLVNFRSQAVQADNKVTDWSTELTADARDTEIVTRVYDPRPQEDGARRRVAYSLLLLLSIVTVGAMILFIIPGTDQEALKNLLNLILGPLVALVSAATGFYFATKR
ncbi:hypothetical protein [Pseudomonas sp. S3_H04]